MLPQGRNSMITSEQLAQIRSLVSLFELSVSQEPTELLGPRTKGWGIEQFNIKSVNIWQWFAFLASQNRDLFQGQLSGCALLQLAFRGSGF